MSKVIIYASKYGSSKKYAEKLHEIMKLPIYSYTDLPNDFSNYHEIILIASLYASGTLGLKKVMEKMNLENTEMTIITVGLADIDKETNIQKIREKINKTIQNTPIKIKNIFHLRGGINYSKLSFTHKLMMKALYTKVKNKPLNEIDDEAREFLDTYGKEVNFIDFNRLESIIPNL
ncbi:MAG: flavodoxin domain-containing protein [Clostridiaceae bacterium]